MSDRTATDTRRRRVRKGSRGSLIAFCAFCLAAPLALAAGDNTLYISSAGADLATNKCKGGSMSMVVNGVPNSPDDYDIYIGSGYSSCTERVRFIGVKKDRHTVFHTGFVYAPNGSENVLSVDNVYRCYIEFGVKRKERHLLHPELIPAEARGWHLPRVSR